MCKDRKIFQLNTLKSSLGFILDRRAKYYFCFMGKFFWVSIVATFFLMTSCIEIIDDLQLNEDGSGTLKYNVNLSASKVKLNSYLALDSLDGKKVPSKLEISSKLNGWVEDLKLQPGIKSVNLESDFTQFIFKLKVEFTKIQDLENGIKKVIQKNDKNSKIKDLDHNWLSFSENQWIRKSPNIYENRAKNLKSEEIKLLKEGSYTSIVRFSKEVNQSSCSSAKISKNRKAVMVRANAYQLILNHNLLDQTISLKEQAKNQ